MADMTMTEGTGISKKLLLIAAVLLGGAMLLKAVGGKKGKGGGKRKRAKGRKKAWMVTPRLRAVKRGKKGRRAAPAWRGVRGSRLFPIPAFPR